MIPYLFSMRFTARDHSLFVENLSGKLSPYKYRLGLSATPEEREYDDVGNEFLLNEIGEIVFEFNLEDAIKKVFFVNSIIFRYHTN